MRKIVVITGAGAGIGLVADGKKAAGIELSLAVLAEDNGLQRSLRNGVLNFRDARRGESENHADRLNLGNHDERTRVGLARLHGC